MSLKRNCLMKPQLKPNGIVLATAAAVFFLAAPMTLADDSTGSVVGRCVGANACKGRSSCKTAHNACKGQNVCKAQGFVSLTKEQCEQVGGRFEPQEAK